MELKLHTLHHIGRNGIAIAALGTFVSKLRQIVGFEFDTIDLVVAAQFLDFLLAVFWWQLVLAVLIAGELFIEILLCEFLSPLLLCTEALRYREERHNRIGIKTVYLHLIQYLHRIGHRFRHIAEDIVHLLACLKPLLLGVQHTGGIIQILACSQTQQMIVSLSILFVHKMGIIGTNQLDTIFLRQFNQHFVSLLLQGECLTIGTDSRIGHFVALKLQIVVIAPKVLMPLD